jgi:hypothetical protein
VGLARHTLAHYGVRGLYLGMSAPLLFGLLRGPIRFGTFEFMRSVMVGDRWQRDSSSALARWRAGLEEDARSGDLLHRLDAQRPSVEDWDQGDAGERRLPARESASVTRSPPRTSLTVWESFGAGLVAGAVEALVVVTPAMTMQTRLIHDAVIASLAREQGAAAAQRRYRGLVDGVRTIVASEGVAGVFRAPGPTVLKGAINQGSRFATYGSLRRALDDAWGARPVTNGFLAGAGAGIVSVLLSQPIDTVRTQMQGLHAARYPNAMACVRALWAAEGVMGLYRGGVPRTARVAIEAGLVFASYEQVALAVERLVGLAGAWR